LLWAQRLRSKTPHTLHGGQNNDVEYGLFQN
jgi:hypothetical protein